MSKRGIWRGISLKIRRFMENVNTLQDLLSMYDIDLQLQLSEDDTWVEAHKEYDNMIRCLNGRSVADLYTAPEMTDQSKKDCLKAIVSVWAPIFCLGKVSFHFVIFFWVHNFSLGKVSILIMYTGSIPAAHSFSDRKHVPHRDYGRLIHSDSR